LFVGGLLSFSIVCSTETDRVFAAVETGQNSRDAAHDTLKRNDFVLHEGSRL